ncbi:acyl-CoA dehydrogenase family protein [Saccharopolyspora phatthalungensis]|uniref:Alkylation response protein AidB-like acyl-CoA dehydrogenase n=1 Tax=Saccharopolyspora phatthalungensis TaxID=664693 RepID=A0A840QF62_9PSEU|nr:acyl-CoA dehydrogenase family protein [Saccharopolyspora phatthalungensis]MBB5157338.1 alkylation response protein AidB-like acyl-CoA dehydrogenase [Saccharopolyspora phatthalungensis]
MTTLDSLVDTEVRSLIEAVLRAHEPSRERELWQQLTELGPADLAFQAAQRMLAILAAETALARTATDAAVLIADDAAPGRLMPAVAVARSCVGHAAEPVVRNAHQVLGAIGTTREHPLHEFTTRILTWRSGEGGARFWDTAVLRYAVEGVSLSDLDLAPSIHNEVEEKS